MISAGDVGCEPAESFLKTCEGTVGLMVSKVLLRYRKIRMIKARVKGQQWVIYDFYEGSNV